MSNRTHISSANTPEVITLFRVPALGARGAEIQVDHLPAAGAFRQLTAANFWHEKICGEVFKRQQKLEQLQRLVTGSFPDVGGKHKSCFFRPELCPLPAW